MNIDTYINSAQQQLNVSQTQQKADALKGKTNEQLEDAAVDFEAMFLTQMLKPMFESIEQDPVFGGGKGEEVFNGFLIEEYGKMLSQSGGIGLADNVKAEMIRMQEMANQI